MENEKTKYDTRQLVVNYDVKAQLIAEAKSMGAEIIHKSYQEHYTPAGKISVEINREKTSEQIELEKEIEKLKDKFPFL